MSRNQELPISHDHLTIQREAGLGDDEILVKISVDQPPHVSVIAHSQMDRALDFLGLDGNVDATGVGVGADAEFSEAAALFVRLVLCNNL